MPAGVRLEMMVDTCSWRTRKAVTGYPHAKNKQKLLPFLEILVLLVLNIPLTYRPDFFRSWGNDCEEEGDAAGSRKGRVLRVL